jgi:hypothetical protein
VDHLAKGDSAAALAEVERAYQQHDDLAVLKSSWGFHGLHQDPRYKAMLHKMNFPE